MAAAAAAAYWRQRLESKESPALYEGEGERCFIRDEDCASEEYDLDSESGGRGLRSSLSLEIYGLQREQQVHFSNREYYRRLEELKSAHLRNMAELERMYISQGAERRREEDGARLGGRPEAGVSVRRLQRINSQEELDFHETSSGSDQSEVYGEDSVGELVLDNPRETLGQDRTFGRDSLLSPDDRRTQKHFWFQAEASCSKPRGRQLGQTRVRVRSSSKVTVPKPFQMMLREEERKRHRVRTRSQIELENTLLRQELEELRECQKKFRASPAPAHIHLPLYEVISRRTSRRPGGNNTHNRDAECDRASVVTSPRPFHFLEREKRKREAKIVAELARLGPNEEQQAFKAQPVPRSVYGGRHRADAKAADRQSHATWPLEREATEGQSDPSSDPESDNSKSEDPPTSRPQRCQSSKPARRQIELSIEMVKEGEWSCVEQLKANACSISSPLQPGGQQLWRAGEPECISV